MMFNVYDRLGNQPSIELSQDHNPDEKKNVYLPNRNHLKVCIHCPGHYEKEQEMSQVVLDSLPVIFPL